MKILTLLSPSWNGELALFKQRMDLEEIPCEKLTADELAALFAPRQLAQEKDILILTDSEETGQMLSRARIPWAGCGKETWFEGAALVLESLEGIDGRFLYEWMRRAQSRPALIAQTERLTLREMEEADIRDLIRIYRKTNPGGRVPSAQQADPGGISSQQQADPGGIPSEQQAGPGGIPSEQQAGPGGIPSEQQADSESGADVFTEEGLTAYMHTAYRLQGYGLWSVLHGDTLIGCCGFAPCEKDALELQYMLDPAYQRQGFGTEMCRAAISYAEERLGITDIRVRIAPDSAASRALAGKLGLPVFPTNGS